ncbi:MAG: Uma2 family endonuclease [Deltaproteobacteria bacterium]|nr:Uma2 family endonuclease [Deltaproteobacteria bacterium]
MVAASRRADAVWYPETDNMGEHALQRFITELLRGVLERWLRAQGRVAFAGANQFVYWREGDPHASRAPDVYVLEGVPQDAPEVGSWKTWEGHAPSFALEVCSADNWQKDYDDAPADYDAMGVRELVIFDPGATPAAAGGYDGSSTAVSEVFSRAWPANAASACGARSSAASSASRTPMDTRGCGSPPVPTATS